jgi:hypothetical protein
MKEIEIGIEAFHGLQVQRLVNKQVLYKVRDLGHNLSYVWKNDEGVWFFEKREQWMSQFGYKTILVNAGA